MLLLRFAVNSNRFIPSMYNVFPLSQRLQRFIRPISTCPIVKCKSYILTDDILPTASFDCASPKTLKIDAVQPLDAEQLTVFDRLLYFLRKDIEFTKMDELLRAPFKARCVDEDRKKIFIEHCDKWWTFAEKGLAGVESRIPRIVYNLGTLNDESRGLLFKKIGGELVLDQLLGRWLDSGLENYELLDTSAGITGLRRLCTRGINGLYVVDKFKLTRWDEFFGSLEKYFINKRHQLNEKESSWIEFEAGGLHLLTVLRQLTVVPSNETLGCLNDWSLIWLRNYLKAGTLDAPIGASIVSYADSWLYFHRNPDKLNPGSLSIWFKSYAKYLDGMKSSGHSLLQRDLQYLPAVAVYFDAVKDFHEVYDAWHSATVQCWRSTNEIIVLSLADFIFSSGSLACKKSTPREMARKLDELVAGGMDIFCNADPSTISNKTFSMALSGYRNAKKVCGGFALPEKLSSFVKHWFVEYRRNERDRLDAANIAAVIFYTLAGGKLSAPDSVLDELSKTYFWGLTYSNEDVMLANLWRFGASCCTFNYDPSNNTEIGERAWSAWFRHAGECMENYKDSARIHRKTRTDFVNLLTSIVRVALTMQRSFEFQRLQATWEKRVLSFSPLMDQKHVSLISHSLWKLEDKYDIIIDPKVSQIFKRKSADAGQSSE